MRHILLADLVLQKVALVAGAQVVFCHAHGLKRALPDAVISVGDLAVDLLQACLDVFVAHAHAQLACALLDDLLDDQLVDGILAVARHGHVLVFKRRCKGAVCAQAVSAAVLLDIGAYLGLAHAAAIVFCRSAARHVCGVQAKPCDGRHYGNGSDTGKHLLATGHLLFGLLLRCLYDELLERIACLLCLFFLLDTVFCCELLVVCALVLLCGHAQDFLLSAFQLSYPQLS